MGDGEGETEPIGEGKDQLESGRDGRNIMEDKEEPIQDVIKEI
jgi:hypothetical protein